MSQRFKLGLSALMLSLVAACSSGETTNTSGGSGSTGTTPPVGTAPSPLDPASVKTPFVVSDQFGYVPDAEKILFARQARAGFDADSFPAMVSSYDVYSEAEGRVVLTVTPTPWNNGRVDSRSGDLVSTLDISELTTPGSYFITETGEQTSLAAFKIKDDIYASVFKSAFKTLYYQRSGFERTAPYADTRFIDGASHLGPGQDSEARRFLAKTASTERDLHGGWYDAGDLNKYTNWTADYCLMLLASFEENPGVWGDNLNLPESGNGVPDVLDEVRWGMDWLLRMQNDDGSVLSILGSDSASPPSSATGPSYYGDASTSATLSSAAAFAYGASIYRAQGQSAYADELETAAEAAWNWAEANPAVVFRNNDPASQTEGLGAGQQEVNDRTRMILRMTAAAHLFALTGDTLYGDVVDDLFAQSPLNTETTLSPYELVHYDALRAYAFHPGANTTNVSQINQQFLAKRLANSIVLNDAYRSPVDHMHWGSNATKAARGLTLLIGNPTDETKTAASGFVHYIHGANPLGIVYMSEMRAFGAQHFVEHLYHHGYQDAAPSGFIVGGPNPTYNWAACCPNSCGLGSSCGGTRPAPPAGQPDLKSYLDFNENWTLAPWQVNENSNGYQVIYLRLLAFYVDG